MAQHYPRIVSLVPACAVGMECSSSATTEADTQVSNPPSPEEVLSGQRSELAPLEAAIVQKGTGDAVTNAAEAIQESKVLASGVADLSINDSLDPDDKEARENIAFEVNAWLEQTMDIETKRRKA